MLGCAGGLKTFSAIAVPFALIVFPCSVLVVDSHTHRLQLFFLAVSPPGTARNIPVTRPTSRAPPHTRYKRGEKMVQRLNKDGKRISSSFSFSISSFNSLQLDEGKRSTFPPSAVMVRRYKLLKRNFDFQSSEKRIEVCIYTPLWWEFHLRRGGWAHTFRLRPRFNRNEMFPMRSTETPLYGNLMLIRNWRGFPSATFLRNLFDSRLHSLRS